MKHLSPFKKTHIFFWLSLSSAVILLGVYVFLFHTMRSMSQQGATLQSEVLALESQESELESVKKNLNDTEDQQKKLSSYFIDQANIVPFLVTIEGYAHDVSANAELGDVKIEENPHRLTLSLSAKGTFRSVYHFISLLEAMPYESTITSIDLHTVVPTGLVAANGSVDTGGWEALISLEVTSVNGQ